MEFARSGWCLLSRTHSVAKSLHAGAVKYTAIRLGEKDGDAWLCSVILGNSDSPGRAIFLCEEDYEAMQQMLTLETAERVLR